jgi:hypothetical protein
VILTDLNLYITEMEYYAFLFLLYMTNAMIVRENVIFEQSREIATTRNRWLVSLVIDLGAYDQSINKLYSTLDDIYKVYRILVTSYDVPKKDRYFWTFKDWKLKFLI